MSKNTDRGFTLLELMITVAIISVLAAMAFPSFKEWLPRQRLKAAARDLVTAMQDAKSEAVQNSTNITLIFDDSSSPGSYKYFIDLDKDGIEDPGESLIKSVNLAKYKSGVDFGKGPLGSGIPIDLAGKKISFTNRGMAVYPVGVSDASFGIIYFENSKKSSCFKVMIYGTGAIKIEESN